MICWSYPLWEGWWADGDSNPEPRLKVLSGERPFLRALAEKLARALDVGLVALEATETFTDEEYELIRGVRRLLPGWRRDVFVDVILLAAAAEHGRLSDSDPGRARSQSPAEGRQRAGPLVRQARTEADPRRFWSARHAVGGRHLAQGYRPAGPAGPAQSAAAEEVIHR